MADKPPPPRPVPEPEHPVSPENRPWWIAPLEIRTKEHLTMDYRDPGSNDGLMGLLLGLLLGVGGLVLVQKVTAWIALTCGS